MATISFPSDPAIRGMRVLKRAATRIGQSPYNFTQQVTDMGGRQRIIEVEWPQMTQAQATTVAQFFEDLEGQVNTFNLDLTPAFPNDPSLSSVPMRLVDSDVGWDIDVAKHYGFTFHAMEAK